MNIPPGTQRALTTDYPLGERHAAKIALSLQLLGNGVSPSAVFVQLQEQFPQASEKEIRDVVAWVQRKNPTPSGNGKRQYTLGKPNGNGHSRHVNPPRTRFDAPPAIKTPPMPARDAVRVLTSGTNSTLQSPVKIPETGQAELLFRSLYSGAEFINIVCAFTTVDRKGETKANPVGEGANKLRDDWIAYFSSKGVPCKEAGAWMRPNPVKKTGSGKDGAITNEDITAFRFLLLESDELTMDEQLAVYARLKLPLSAILTSGGASAHGWLRLDAESTEDYAAKAVRVYAALKAFGFDQANKNPSRLSRLVGAKRTIGATGDGRQQLLYLAPDAPALTDDELCALEIRVRPPKYAHKPMREAAQDALDFYEDIAANKHKTGLRTGFPIFDSITGGLKRGWLTIISGETNSGKTSLVLNIVLNALTEGKGVALFSFEMDMQEIVDIFFAREANVNRNKFNNGYFGRSDFHAMGEAFKSIAEFPLYCFDDPLMTIADVMECCERLKSENDLSLIVVDYLQLTSCEAFRDSREQQVAFVSRMSKAMAKKFKAPVIAVSQLNEDGKVRESRGIAHDANCMIKVIENDDGSIEAKLNKGRSIPKGSYYFRFEREFCRFIETGCDDKLRKMIPKAPDDEPQI